MLLSKSLLDLIIIFCGELDEEKIKVCLPLSSTLIFKSQV